MAWLPEVIKNSKPPLKSRVHILASSDKNELKRIRRCINRTLNKK